MLPSKPQQSSKKSGLELPYRIFNADTSDFREKFERATYMFSHNLVGHPLFELPRLVELANTLLNKGYPEKVVCMVSDSSVINREWGEIPKKEQFAEAISRIEESDSLVFLKSVHLDPEYDALLKKCLAELGELTGFPLQKEIVSAIATIIIASPHSITPYHIDHSSNFLFQIQGEKDVYLFEPYDRSVLTEQEIEQYCTGNEGAPKYREENLSKASIYHLIPGQGVHQPDLAPHWVKNGNNISVSLSINFRLRSFDRLTKVYQVNHYMRKLGLKPNPPGRFPLRDRFKISTSGMLVDPLQRVVRSLKQYL